jgi:L-methionine (R)-S-oxide reductase
MAYQVVDYPREKTAFYKMLGEQLAIYTANAPMAMAALANASAVMAAAMRDINWAGFYLVDDERLVLGPFQGQPAVMTIPFGHGVCGAAWKDRQIQVVHDVHGFVGHIACDCSSNAEIVVPILDAEGRVLGVIDMDSSQVSRFDDADAAGLQKVAEFLSTFMIHG